MSKAKLWRICTKRSHITMHGKVWDDDYATLRDAIHAAGEDARAHWKDNTRLARYTFIYYAKDRRYGVFFHSAEHMPMKSTDDSSYYVGYLAHAVLNTKYGVSCIDYSLEELWRADIEYRERLDIFYEAQKTNQLAHNILVENIKKDNNTPDRD